jgi:hypothetical protein
MPTLEFIFSGWPLVFIVTASVVAPCYGLYRMIRSGKLNVGAGH